MMITDLTYGKYIYVWDELYNMSMKELRELLHDQPDELTFREFIRDRVDRYQVCKSQNEVSGSTP